MQYQTKIHKLAKSEVEMEISLDADLLKSARKKALELLSISLDIPGFRKGHIPENIIVERVGEERILDEAVDILLKEHFPKVIEQEKLDIIGQPKISVTKLALGNPIEFKATFAVLPEFKLPDYRAISKSSVAGAKLDKKDEVTEKEIEDVLLQIRKNKAHFDWHQANPDHKPARTTDSVQSGGEHDHPDLEKEESLPALDDELAKSAGNFKDLNELKEKIKENIIIEKTNRNKDKKRAEIMEALAKNTKIDLPEILIESETNKSIAQMKDDIARMKGKWEDYLTHIKKSEDDLRKDLRESSERKAKIQLIFNKIAEVENIKPDKTILENEVKEVMKHYPEASEQNARIYVSTILQNSAVLKLLEN